MAGAARGGGAIATRPVRVRGTIGGSLAHADPAAELPLVAVAFGAEIVIRSSRAERRVAGDSFFLGAHRTALEANEAIVEIAIPAPPAGSVSAFFEVAPRVIGWPLAATCAVITISDGIVARARLATGGASSVPRRSLAGERELVGSAFTPDSIERAAAAAAAEFATDATASDGHGDLVAPVVRRVLQQMGAGR